MLSTALPTILASLACLVSILAAVFAYKAVGIAARGSASSVSVQKLTQIETDLTDTHDMIDGLQTALRKMRARKGMQETRARRADAIPDPQTDPTGYKTAMRARLAAQGRLNGKFHTGS